MDKENQKKLEYIIEKLSELPYISCIFLFGSQLKKPRQDSDIDIAVLTKKITSEQESEIRGYSNNLLDISIFSKLPLIIQFRILKEGKIIFCRDKEELHKIKVKTFIHYLDYSGFINNFYKGVIKNV